MKIKKLKEYECGQNDDDDGVVMVFVAVSRAGKFRSAICNRPQYAVL